MIINYLKKTSLSHFLNYPIMKSRAANARLFIIYYCFTSFINLRSFPCTISAK